MEVNQSQLSSSLFYGHCIPPEWNPAENYLPNMKRALVARFVYSGENFPAEQGKVIRGKLGTVPSQPAVSGVIN